MSGNPSWPNFVLALARHEFVLNFQQHLLPNKNPQQALATAYGEFRLINGFTETRKSGSERHSKKSAQAPAVTLCVCALLIVYNVLELWARADASLVLIQFTRFFHSSEVGLSFSVGIEIESTSRASLKDNCWNRV
jgi:hypothetical protein